MKKGEFLLVRTLLIGVFLLAVSFAFVLAIPTFGENWGNTVNVTEDSLISYNFSANVTDSVSETWTFRIENISGNSNITSVSGYYWISLNSNTGIMSVNATRNNESGFFNVSIFVGNPNDGEARPFYFNISAVNDAPYFTNLANLSFNMSQAFSRVFNVADEESNYPYSLNITFLSCDSAEWWNSSLNGCELFNSSEYSFNQTTGVLNITFTPGKYDVGSYLINFTVRDSGSVSPVNASSSQIINFTVLDVNTAPSFTDICGNTSGAIYINMTEDQNYGCYFNVSDVGENKNITFNFTSLSSFSSDLGWFFNLTEKATNLSVNYTAFVYINVTPSLRNVGDWNINVTALDTGAPRNLGRLGNSTSIRFYVGYVNHSVSLGGLTDVNRSNGTSAPVFIFYVNASDDDFLIPDKSVYNESISFNITVNGAVVSWVNLSSAQLLSNTNITTAGIRINSGGQAGGTYTVNVTVRDANRYSIASSTFNLTIRPNSIPAWNSSVLTNLVSWEGNNTYLNLSQNVSDADGDAITFSSSSDTDFSSFSISSSTGIINFSSNNLDVGRHLVNITATDTLSEYSTNVFNFTIYNANEAPGIRPLTTWSLDEATLYTATNTITVREDAGTAIHMQIEDNDFLIPQKSFYNESINLAVTGVNQSLLNFVHYADSSNRSFYSADFTPSVSDIGTYNVTLLAVDASGLNSTLSFNFTVLGHNRAPVLLPPNTTNYIYTINDAFYIDFNSTDREDIGEGNLTYSIKNLTSANFLAINSTAGVINISFNQSHAGGPWRFNVTVNDTDGATDSWAFNLTVYDYPKINYPLLGTNLTFSENNPENITFNISHSVANDLNYSVYLNDILRNFTSGYGNGRNFTVYIRTNYSDHFCDVAENFSINVSNLRLSNYTSWNLNVTNVEEPLTLYENISNAVGGSIITLNLSDYFEDADASDPCYEQQIVFYVNPVSANGITYSVSSDWTGSNIPTVTFTSSQSKTGTFSIIGYEYNITNTSQIIRTVESNNFTVQHIITSTVTTTITHGGGSATKIVSIKIILPGPVSTLGNEVITIPIKIENPSEVSLSGITLSAVAGKDGVVRKDFVSAFDKSFIDSLASGKSENVKLSVAIGTRELGTYELTVYANVSSPVYSDWGKVYIKVEEGTKIQEKILFTEKLVVENPECLELKEMVDEAKAAYAAGDYTTATQKIDAATDACKKVLAQKNSFLGIKKVVNLKIVYYVLIACGAAVGLGFGFYYYKRYRLMRVMKGY